MTDGCRHPAHLTVSPFADCQLEPTVGYALAEADRRIAGPENGIGNAFDLGRPGKRSEEHTSELQSLMRNSYAVFCLKKKKNKRLQQLYIVPRIPSNTVN